MLVGMWLTRVLGLVEEARRPVVLGGAEAFGAPYIIDALRGRTRVAWLQVTPRMIGDPVGQGNALAQALNAVAGATLFAHAMPVTAHLRAMRHYRMDLQPLVVAVSDADLEPTLARRLFDLADDGYRLVVSVDDEGVFGDERVTVIGRDTLRLSPHEALQIAPNGLPPETLKALYADADGRYTPFTGAAARAVGLPRVYVPTPFGPAVANDDAESFAAEVTVQALQREGRLVEALDLAVMRQPELVEALLRRAGPAYQEEGLLPRLHLLLSSLPDPYRGAERVLEWRTVAALSVDDVASVAEEVDEHLAAFRAPELRARRAGTLTQAEGLPLAEQALALKRTPLTVWQYGRLVLDHRRGIEVLRDSVRLAEDLGTPYDIARNASELANRLAHVGDFQRSASWAHWALQVFDEAHLHDGIRRLRIVNMLASARILSGDLVGLRRMLEDAQVTLEGTLPQLASTYRSTLSWLEQATGHGDAALELARATYEGSPRAMKTRFAYQYVRALNEVGDTSAALRIADEAVELSGHDLDYRRLPGCLARGMALAVRGDEAAADALVPVMVERDAVLAESRIAAALHYLLITDGAAHNVPDDLATLLSTLHPTALRVLSGPETLFAGVWSRLSRGAELRLSFLGTTRCRLRDDVVHLPNRLAEIALALALRPDGISVDELHAFVSSGDDAGPSLQTLYAHIKRLRKLLPFSEPPYHFVVPFEADITRAREFLQRNRVREAISLLQGPLLPTSHAHGVEEQRQVLEEELRQAALLADDPDALFELADRLGDDLELWEAADAALPDGDPRAAITRARLRRLGAEYGVQP